MDLYIDDHKLVTDGQFDIDNQIAPYDRQNQTIKDDSWSEIFGINTGTTWGDHKNLLRIIQLAGTDGAIHYGNNAAAIFFGSADTKAGLEVKFDKPAARIVGGNNPNIRWSEDIAWKSDIQKLEQEIADLKKQIGGVLSRSITHIVDDNFDMNSAQPGTYRSWGTKPINAPSNAAAWAKYFVIPFVEGDSSSMFQIAIDTNGNMFVRAKGGDPAVWNLWHKVNLG